MNEKCFALRKDCTCNALATENCVGYLNCPFYKPVWQQQQGQEKVDARLQTLLTAQQDDISEKYYNGNMPWKGELV